MTNRRTEFLSYLRSFIGSRYQWGGEGGYNVGFDCSGLVLEGLRAFGLWGIKDATSQGIFDELSKKWGESKGDAAGALLFFGRDKGSISHVGISLGNGQFIEAGGGGKQSVDVGMVRIRPMSWRKDLVAVIDLFSSAEEQ